MKISLALGQRRAIDRAVAWGCFTGNLAIPGSGSLLAGRISGYPQLLLSLCGMLLTGVYGVRFMLWFLSNYSRLQSPDADAIENLHGMWDAGKWAFLGIGIFGLAWMWSLISSLLILASAKPLSGNTAGAAAGPSKRSD